MPAPLALDGSFWLHGLDAEPALAYLERALPLKAQGGRIDANGAAVAGCRRGACESATAA